jgi:hypothetical protein
MSSFQASTGAISRAATDFDHVSAQIDTLERKSSEISGSSGNTGKAYAAQGTGYKQAMTDFLDKLISEFGRKTEWMSATLSQTASDYTSSDRSGTSSLRAGGRGA